MTRYAIRRQGSDANIGPTYASATEAHLAIISLYTDDLETHVVQVEDPEWCASGYPARDALPTTDPEDHA